MASGENLADAGWKEMNRQVAALEADLAAMRARAEFAQHRFSCDTLRSDRPPGPCDCGFAALAASSGAAR